MQRLSHRTKGGCLPDPGERDGGTGCDVVDVGAYSLLNLVLPVGFGVDRVPDVLDHRLVVGPQQFDEAVLLAGELAIEGAFGGAGVTDDVGHRGVPVAALVDRGVEAV